MIIPPLMSAELLPYPGNGMYKDVLPRPQRRAKAYFVQLPVAVIPKLRKLGMGPFCAYAAITFQSAVQKQNEVTVPARTWSMFGCRPDDRYLHIRVLVEARLVESAIGSPGKPLKLRLTTVNPAEAPPME